MVYEVMRHLRNFFASEVYTDIFEIKNGTITLPFLKSGQYFIIEGSVFNDGAYVYPSFDLQDEIGVFNVVSSKPPKDFLSLCEEIETWQAEYGTKNEPYSSESFGGYSRTIATNADGNQVSWQNVFKDRLNIWRKR